MVKITGRKAHAARLKKIRGPAMVREVGKAVYAASDYLKTEAQISITTGAVSGANHVPSAPGTPPNADTHHLSNSIENHMTGPLKAETSANAEYAAIQEFGGSTGKATLQERPYIRPAAQKTRKPAQKLVAAAVKKVTTGGAL